MYLLQILDLKQISEHIENRSGFQWVVFDIPNFWGDWMAKRKYTHKKGRIVTIEHGSIADEIEHDLAPYSKYKTRRKRLI